MAGHGFAYGLNEKRTAELVVFSFYSTSDSSDVLGLRKQNVVVRRTRLPIYYSLLYLPTIRH